MTIGDTQVTKVQPFSGGYELTKKFQSCSRLFVAMETFDVEIAIWHPM